MSGTLHNPLNLDGKVVLVTGASSGIGRATSVLLSQLGATVVLNGRDPDRLEKTLALLQHDGHMIKPFDLSAIDEIPGWLSTLGHTSGTLDGVVHCAGVHLLRPVRALSSSDVSNTLRINVEAAFGLVQGFRQKRVRARPAASIVLVSSVMGLVGQPGASAYSASKGAVIAMTKSLALELVRDSIRVNCVVPGQVQSEMTDRQQKVLTAEQFAQITEMHPMGIGTPLDVAYACAFLLADTARWITGTSLVVDGGYTAQ